MTPARDRSVGLVWIQDTANVTHAEATRATRNNVIWTVIHG
ncbi:hypothetical protein RISK_004340 [Rhodopirellula islandica]|uniref:Uncharacterized protein n=1 Tax=Rhodopirellula islandica TaxID=595434 RepID=A0A0J1BBL9_RHOIS|nr:hypothetical protein RISK_004340 [Rhodopirellula islandica]